MWFVQPRYISQPFVKLLVVKHDLANLVNPLQPCDRNWGIMGYPSTLSSMGCALWSILSA